MRIGIDYTSALRQRAGIGRYTRNLVRALVQQDETNRYLLFAAGGKRGPDTERWPAHVAVRHVPISDRWLHLLWQRIRIPLPVQLATGSLDLFHSPDFVLPPVGSTPTIVTVHDLSFVRVPECFVAGFTDYLRRAVSRAVDRADLVLADSQSTRADLIELMGVNDAKITVLYPGVEARFGIVHDAECLRRVRAAYSLPEDFVLGLGTLQPRKNFTTLIEAFGRMLKDRPKEHGNLHLVIVGEKGWMCDGIYEAAGTAPVNGRVHLVGFVEDADLPAFYNLASVFAFPSYYEGFGLPVLEAMACGVPVVAANNSALPEVVGEAGLLIGANDTDGLAHALRSLVSDHALRERLIAAGQKQAQRFSWERAGAQLLTAYGRGATRQAIG